MTLPVSTSGSEHIVLSGLSEAYRVAVLCRVVGDAVVPAAPDDADPGAGQYAYGVGMVVAASAGVGVDLGRPWVGVAAVVGECGDRDAEAFVAGPTEVHGPMPAGLVGDGGGSGQGGDGVGAVIGLPAVAPLGEHLGGVDLTRPWQRREDRLVRGLPEGGDRAAVQISHGADQGLQYSDQGEDRVADRFTDRFVEGAGGCATQPREQLFGGGPAAGAVLDAERGKAFGAPVLGGS